MGQNRQMFVYHYNGLPKRSLKSLIPELKKRVKGYVIRSATFLGPDRPLEGARPLEWDPPALEAPAQVKSATPADGHAPDPSSRGFGAPLVLSVGSDGAPKKKSEDLL